MLRTYYLVISVFLLSFWMEPSHVKSLMMTMKMRMNLNCEMRSAYYLMLVCAYIHTYIHTYNIYIYIYVCMYVYM
jgi:hypothetical protein